MRKKRSFGSGLLTPWLARPALPGYGRWPNAGARNRKKKKGKGGRFAAARTKDFLVEKRQRASSRPARIPT